MEEQSQSIRDAGSEESSLRALSTARIQALADGVFAIVITLMVFQIQVPNLSPGRQGALRTSLGALWPQFAIYILTFAVAGVFWVGHHALFHYCIRRSDRILLWLSLAYLMCVAFIPFSSSLLGRYPNQQVAVVWYGTHMALISLLLYAQFRYATSNPHLVAPEVTSEMMRFSARRILTTPAACLLAIAFSFVHVTWSVTIYGLILVFYIFVPTRVELRARRQAAEQAEREPAKR